MAVMEQLKKLRETAGLSQNALAQAIGRSHTYVWGVEAGRERLTNKETILAWAEALGVHPDEVYHAVGAIPHDLLEFLENTGPETWRMIRNTLHQMNEAKGR